MVGQSAKSDRKGRFLLKISTYILLVAFSLSLIFLKSQFKSPLLIIWAFLQPACQNGIAMVFYDEILSSRALLTLFFTLPLATVIFAAFAKVSMEVLVLISSVYIVWGGLFQIGLGLTRSMPLHVLYGGMAMSFLGTLQREKGLVWTWLCIVPVSLTTGMTILSGKFSDDIGAGDGARDPLMETVE